MWQQMTGCGCAGPTDKELQKEVTGYLIRTPSARARHKHDADLLHARRFDAAVLGENEQEVVDEGIADGVMGYCKAALPKAALGMPPATSSCLHAPGLM